MLSNSDRRFERFVYCVFLSLLFTLPALAQISSIPDSMSQTGLGGVNSIVGTVFGPSGRPIESRVRVQLSSMMSGSRTTTTNENGSFAFRGLPTGTYTISVEKEKEYEPTSHSVDIMTFRGSPPQTYTLNIRLALKVSAETKPTVLPAEFAGVPQPAIDLYTKALELAKSADHKGAVEQLQLAIANHPGFMLAHSELGVQYLRLNDVQKADESFQAALKISPDAFNPLVNRGMLLVTVKRFEEAELVLRKVVAIKNDSAVGHYFLGQALANLGKFDEAKRELSTAVKLGGEQMKEAHRILAIIYNAEGDKKRAATELETYLKLYPTAPDAEQLKKVIAQWKSGN